MKKMETKVKCEVCGGIHTVRTNLLTGWRYSAGWTIRCIDCGGICKEIKDESRSAKKQKQNHRFAHCA